MGNYTQANLKGSHYNVDVGVRRCRALYILPYLFI